MVGSQDPSHMEFTGDRHQGTTYPPAGSPTRLRRSRCRYLRNPFLALFTTLLLPFVFLPRLYVKLFKEPGIPPPTTTRKAKPRTGANTLIQWTKLSEKLKIEWPLVIGLAFVLLPLNVTLLQLSDIASQRTTKTAAVLSFWFATASFICGCINQLSLSPVEDTYEAILENSNHQSFMLWTLMFIFTLPTSFAIWSCTSLIFTAAAYSLTGPPTSTTDATPPKPVVIVALAFIALMMLPYIPVMQGELDHSTIATTTTTAATQELDAPVNDANDQAEGRVDDQAPLLANAQGVPKFNLSEDDLSDPFADAPPVQRNPLGGEAKAASLGPLYDTLPIPFADALPVPIGPLGNAEDAQIGSSANRSAEASAPSGPSSDAGAPTDSTAEAIAKAKAKGAAKIEADLQNKLSNKKGALARASAVKFQPRKAK